MIRNKCVTEMEFNFAAEKKFCTNCKFSGIFFYASFSCIIFLPSFYSEMLTIELAGY